MKAPFFRKKNSEDQREDSVGGRIKRFAEGVADFFDPEPEKEKVLRREDFRGAGDDYYAVVSSRYKIAERIFAVLCVIFLLFSIFTNISDITYGNLFYFVRDFGTAVDIASTDYETLSYDVYKNQNFTLFRGGIAAVSPSNVSLYTATGRRTLRSHSSYVTPYSVASKKYLLAYDISGNSFSLYNSFSKVYTENLEYPITDAAISDEGLFAVVTRSAEFKSVINVYNDKIKLRARISYPQYCFDVSVDGQGERMAVLFYEVGDGRGVTTLRVYDISKHKGDEEDAEENTRLIYETAMDGVFPLKCSFFENGSLCVITDGAVSIIDDKYKTSESLGYTEEISAICADKNGAAVALRSGALNDLNKVISFDEEGKLFYNGSVQSSVEEIGVRGGYIFLKSTQGASRFDVSSEKLESYDCQTGTLMVYDESTAIVCGESSAVYIKFQNG